MAQIYNSFTELIGRTPIVRLNNIEKEEQLQAKLLVKVEAFNPGGSVKDRIALAMIEQAEKDGLLKPGGIIVEPTSGNTGIGLAWVGAVKGYKVIIVLPETMSIERRKLIAAYGAELVLTPGSEGMKGAIAKAKEIVAANPGSFLPLQFENAANPAIHESTTGEEIWRDTDGDVDIFVAGVGTGGTVSGVAKKLKSYKPSVKSVAVEPSTSAVLSGNAPGPHKIQGIGAGFEPKNFNREYIDEIFPVSSEDAIATSRRLGRNGFFAGISSGASLFAAIELAKRPENKGKTIVALLPDTGERYLSTALIEQ
ncbi:MAG: cysteine synthase A [Paludibacteraceae bacterium]|nr:cysteine synthase A [Paludibacteraceae bacterium]